MGEIQERLTKSISDTTNQLEKRFRPQLHPRDEHGRFAVKPGSSMDVGLRRADRANARGAVIGGPEAIFDIYRRTVIDLKDDARPELRRAFGVLPEHAPQGGTGAHGKHRPEVPHLEVHKPDIHEVDMVLGRLVAHLRPRDAIAQTPEDEAALDEAVRRGFVKEVNVFGSKHYSLTYDGAARAMMPQAA